MRTKALLGLAVLAAGLTTSVAVDTVYSINVVGYVNQSFPDGGTTYMITTPFNTTNNIVKEWMPSPPNGTAIYMYEPAIDDFTNNYNFNGGVWDAPNARIDPGAGFFLYVPEPFTNTFVGEVPQKETVPPVPVVGGGTVSMIGSPVPISGGVTNILTDYVPAEGDSVYQWDPTPTVQDLAGNYSYNGGAWSGTITNIGTCEAFLLYRGDPGVTWLRKFTVQ